MNTDTNKIKLSDKQKEVIRLMREGWGTAITYGMYAGAWMQKNGIGKGGESKSLRPDTVHRLIDLKLIEDNNESKRYSDKHFSLTELGKTIKL
jgi:hypothetical protein